MNKFVIIPKEQYDKFKEVQNLERALVATRDNISENKSKKNLSETNSEDTNTDQDKSEPEFQESSNTEVPPPPGLPVQSS